MTSNQHWEDFRAGVEELNRLRRLTNETMMTRGKSEGEKVILQHQAQAIEAAIEKIDLAWRTWKQEILKACPEELLQPTENNNE